MKIDLSWPFVNELFVVAPFFPSLWPGGCWRNFFLLFLLIMTEFMVKRFLLIDPNLNIKKWGEVLTILGKVKFPLKQLMRARVGNGLNHPLSFVWSLQNYLGRTRFIDLCIILIFFQTYILGQIQ